MNKISLSFDAFELLCNTFYDARDLVTLDYKKNIELTQENCSGIGSSLKLRIPICLKSDVKEIKENTILEIDLTNVQDW
jgi:hypothetical protein